MIGRFKKRKIRKDIEVHETWSDTMAEKGFSISHGEGKLTKSIDTWSLVVLGVVYLVGIIIFASRAGYLQIAMGEDFKYIGDTNTFDKKIVFAPRGSILDRNGEPLAWSTNENDTFIREYKKEGFGSLLGQIHYPAKDTKGEYYRTRTEGVSGLESFFDSNLSERNGSIVLEKDALDSVISELFLEKPIPGDDVRISIDAGMQGDLYNAIRDVATERDFKGGAGAMMDVETGEILALASYPDFDANILTNGTPKQKETLLFSRESGFIHRAVSGLYTPGSTVKPFFAVAALEEEVVKPEKVITSTGSIKVESPYDPDVVYTFKDWKALGPLNLPEALAWSSNVYFYHIGGGFADVDGLGIDKLHFYARLFGFEKPTSLGFLHEPEGLVPNPGWKEDFFDEDWRVGDTYNTVIGQYNFQVTPLQLLRATNTIASGGLVVEPHLNPEQSVSRKRKIVSSSAIDIAQDGMKKAVEIGTSTLLQNIPLDLAVKTGTAQIGNEGLINSLLVGFFPYNEPKYSFVIIMERGEQDAAIAASINFFNLLLERYPDIGNNMSQNEEV